FSLRSSLCILFLSSSCGIHRDLLAFPTRRSSDLAEDFIPKFEVTTSLLSRSISYAIERYRLVVQLQNQALTDQLTQLPNRAAVYERLDSLISDCDRRAIRFGIALLDLDDFKSVNDNLGHRAGDDLLRQISAR